MSKVQVDKVVNLSDDGAPQLTYGAELPVGYGLTGAGGLNISGVVTAASAVFSGNVTIGGTLTYEDVTNIDVVGVSTFAGRMNVNSTINANEGIKVIGVSTLAAVTGTTGTFSGDLGVGDNSPDARLHVTETIDVAYTVDTVTSEANNLVKLENPSTTANAFSGMQFRVGSGADMFVGAIQQSANAGDLYVVNQNAPNKELLRIKSTSKVGLGTNNPQLNLHIHSESSNASFTHFTNTTTGVSASDGVSIGLDSDENAVIYNYESTAIRFATAGSERLRIDSSGRLLIGQTSADADLGSQLQVAGSSYAASGILQARLTADQYGPALDLLKSRNTSWGSHTIVQSGDQLGRIYFRGDDGSDYGNAGAAIFGEVDGTPGSDDMPGRLTFSTSADGSVSLTERLRIDSSGRVLIGSSDGASYADSSLDDLIVGSTANGKNDGITILSGTGQNGSLAFADSGGTSRGLVGYVHNGDYLRLHAGATLKVRIDTDGLKFNSDTAAGSALNDYERGDWSIGVESGASAVSHSQDNDQYIKVGNLVTVLYE